MEKIKLKTADGFQLAALHYKVATPSAGISLLHMIPATKESYNKFCRELQLGKIGALAVDLRGHGTDIFKTHEHLVKELVGWLKT